MGVEAIPQSITWIDAQQESPATVEYIDQTKLPHVLDLVRANTIEDVQDAIARLAVRGAPAIGVAGAMGVALWAAGHANLPAEPFLAQLNLAADKMVMVRPTAVNLAWAVEQMRILAREEISRGEAVKSLVDKLIALAKRLAQEDIETNRKIGKQGATLIKPQSCVLTHCNAGSLATVHFGTALGVIYTAHEEGKINRVFADETRPVGQGARLTCWELMQAGVPCTLLPDSAAASLLQSGTIDCVIVGADRIARNGDTANKIGTMPLALAARHARVPFYIAAPCSTIDLTCATGAGIPIEQRSSLEVTSIGAPKDVAVYNPAFDVTPGTLIDAIITEKGVVFPRKCLEQQGQFDIRDALFSQ